MNYLNIKWIKNINNGTGDAYTNFRNGPFRLHFPDTNETNPASPEVGEIIVLYQRINKQKVFTHLVSPIDTIVHVDLNRPRQRIYRNVIIIAARSIKVEDTDWRNVDFRGISQGNVCRIENITSVIDYYGANHEALLLEIWKSFEA
jgi:hypothetical protein